MHRGGALFCLRPGHLRKMQKAKVQMYQFKRRMQFQYCFSEVERGEVVRNKFIFFTILNFPFVVRGQALSLRSIFNTHHFCHAENENPLQRQEAFQGDWHR